MAMVDDPFGPPPFRMRLAAWLRRLDLRTWLPALPALVAVAGGAVVAATAALTPADDLAARYLADARQSLARGDAGRAEVAYERLVRRWPERPEYRYELAMVVHGRGEAERAGQILAGLAPPDRPGYPPAHLWQAERLLDASPLTPAAARAAEAHLVRVVKAQPESVPAHARLGELYAKTGRPALAEPLLRKAIRARPDLLLTLARVLAARGDGGAAQSQAEEARRRALAAVKADPGDVAARLHAAEAALFLRDFPGALSALRVGPKAAADARLHRAAASVYLAWSDSRAREGEEQLGAVVDLLERGLKEDPAHAGLLQRLLTLTKGAPPGSDRARAALQDLVTRGQATATVSLILGIDASRRGRADEARRHWEEAHRLDPNFPAVNNNLAWALAHAEPPDLDRALTLVSDALQRQPGDPNFRDTRGQILLKLGRWQEAVTDLEAALPAKRDDPALHRALASAYEHLGARELAERHRRAASPSYGVLRAGP